MNLVLLFLNFFLLILIHRFESCYFHKIWIETNFGHIFYMYFFFFWLILILLYNIIFLNHYLAKITYIFSGWQLIIFLIIKGLKSLRWLVIVALSSFAEIWALYTQRWYILLLFSYFHCSFWRSHFNCLNLI